MSCASVVNEQQLTGIQSPLGGDRFGNVLSVMEHFARRCCNGGHELWLKSQSLIGSSAIYDGNHWARIRFAYEMPVLRV
jgi:hypothetical protein